MSRSVLFDGLGINLPDKILDNKELEKIVDTTVEWIVSRTGIKQRRIADKNTKLFELAVPAAMEAIERSSIAIDAIDMVICATSTADMAFPSTASLIQGKLKLTNASAFDMQAACSGFVYGLHVATALIKGKAANNILLVGVEIMSRIINWKDRSTCILFGDGASAVLLKADEDEKRRGVIDSKIFSDGSYANFLMAGYNSASYKGSADDLETDTVYEGVSPFLSMKGSQVFKLAIKCMSDIAEKLLKDNKIDINDIDLVIPHQANIRIISAINRNLNIPDEKVFVNLNKYGNTSAATIPIALYEAEKEGKLKKGDLVLLISFGGGFTWGGSLVRW